MIRRPWFVMLSCAVLLVVICAVCLAVLRMRASVSRVPERGRVVERVASCPAGVEILFDDRGIPHVTSANEPAVWFSQGYLHARERFFQMELARRQAEGRMAELFGESALDDDRSIRVLRLAASAGRQVAMMSGDERAVLKAYTDGVNAALNRYGRWIAPEMWLLGVDPEPWKAEDSLAIGLLLQLDLSRAMGRELQRAEELSRLGRERAVDLWGWTPAEARAWIPPGDGLAGPLRESTSIVPQVDGLGSNAWAIAPARSATGNALLAADPHFRIGVPGAMYAIHLRGPGLHVAGASIPGMPGILIGHTEHVAWGLTPSLLDDQDLFLLTLDDSGTRELVDGRWKPLRTVTEQISVRWDKTPVLLKIRVSEHGPVVRELQGQALALAWSGLHGPSPLRGILGMDRAATATDAARAWQDVVGPAMNLIAADTEGHILEQVTGRAPLRGEGAGKLPAPGADSRWAWKGFRRSSANPSRVDPGDGLLAASAHDLFTEGDFPPAQRFSGEFASPWSVRRIRTVLGARSDWTVEDMAELQGDVLSGRAVAMLKLLWKDLEAHGGPTASTLMSWDGRMEASSVAAHLFSALVLELDDAVGGDEGELYGLRGSPIGPEEVLRLLAGGLDESWWNDVRENRQRTRSEVVAETLDRLDAAAADQPWGTVHDALFVHPLAATPGVGRLFSVAWNRGSFPVGGDNVTVNAEYWCGRDPFAVQGIPVARFVADVGNWDDTVLVLPMGASGRPWSPHYADQLEAWLAVEPVRFPFSREAVEAAATARLELLPGDAGGAAQ